ncbi:MAG: dTDP-4-dehydrorhamnose 3,5-epimerase family protein [Candidatus Hodarchaeota archaeon]
MLLEGIKVKSLERHFDERGSFTEILRTDWEDLSGEDVFVQANLSISYPGIIRAWHRHLLGQIDYFTCLKGIIKLCAFNENKELTELFVTGQELEVVRIPGIYWHGYKVLGDKPASLVYFVNKLYDYENPDEERKPWNDKTIIPKSINGRSDDPRVGLPWDWNYQPHK